MDTNTEQPTQTKSAPVMDIAPGQQSSQPPAPAAAPAETPVAESPVQAPPADTAPEDQAVPATAEPEQATPLVAATSKNTHQHKAPIGVIVVAVLVATALAGVAVLTYLNNDKKETASQQQTPATTQKAEEQPAVTADDVDTASNDLSQSLDEADDATDFDANAVSDTGLNL